MRTKEQARAGALTWITEARDGIARLSALLQADDFDEAAAEHACAGIAMAAISSVTTIADASAPPPDEDNFQPGHAQRRDRLAHVLRSGECPRGHGARRHGNVAGTLLPSICDICEGEWADDCADFEIEPIEGLDDPRGVN